MRYLNADARTAILDATDRLLARYGYAKMTVEDVAREAGIGKGTVYLHFRSKEEVVLSLVDRIVGGVLERLRAIAEADAPAPAKVREMLLARVLERFDAFQHYSQSLHDLLAALRPALVAQRDRQLEAEARLFADVLREGTERGAFRAADADRAARALLTATNSLLPYYLSPEQLGGRDAIAARTRDVADLLLDGLRSGAGARSAALAEPAGAG